MPGGAGIPGGLWQGRGAVAALLLLGVLAASPASAADTAELVEAVLVQRLDSWWQREMVSLGGAGAMPSPQVSGSCRIGEMVREEVYPGLMRLELECSLDTAAGTVEVTVMGIGPTYDTARRDAAVRIARFIEPAIAAMVLDRAAKRTLRSLSAYLTLLDQGMAHIEAGRDALTRLPESAETRCGGER